MNVHEILVEEIMKTKEILFDSTKINDETNLVTDLNFNSIDFMQLVVNIEKRFSIAFDLDEYMDSQDINMYKSVKDYISTKVA